MSIQNQIPLIPVILSGGSGTRLWPLSRSSYPKQFLSFVGDLTLIQQTVQRVQTLTEEAPIVIANQEHRFLVAEQLQAIHVDPAHLVLEPVGRNTAPAITIAALLATQNGEDPILLVLPADHIINDQKEFIATLTKARSFAAAGHLVVFGVKPTRSETNYGYIQCGEAEGPGIFAVKQFVEKPNLMKANAYLVEGGYLWNSGMFMFKASRFLAEMQKHALAIYEQCELAFRGMITDLDFKRLPVKAFSAVPSNSIDYAIMEKCTDSLVIALDAEWADIGFWTALLDIKTRDGNGNAIQGDVLIEDVKNTFISAHSRLVAAIGINDHIIVETEDAVLVAHKDKVHEVKKIVDVLKKSERKEVDSHSSVFRPWGCYKVLVEDSGYQVKRLIVNPKKSLSLQLHNHRVEHWIVVRGTAHVTCGDKVFLLSENESTYIPKETKHRLENRDTTPLEVIEVQVGHYLHEDDIIRFEDLYGRISEVI